MTHFLMHHLITFKSFLHLHYVAVMIGYRKEPWCLDSSWHCLLLTSSPCFPCDSISLHISAVRRKVAAKISTRSTVAGKKEGKKEKIFKALLPLSAFTSFPSLFLFSQPLILAAPVQSGHRFWQQTVMTYSKLFSVGGGEGSLGRWLGGRVSTVGTEECLMREVFMAFSFRCNAVPHIVHYGLSSWIKWVWNGDILRGLQLNNKLTPH